MNEACLLFVKALFGPKSVLDARIFFLEWLHVVKANVLAPFQHPNTILYI